MAGRYINQGPFAIEIVRRATVCGPAGITPEGVTQIVSPNNTVLLIGRVLVESDSDLATAYGLEKQI